MQDPKVKDYLYRQFVSFKAQQSVGDINHALLGSPQLGGPVVDEQRRLLGWISERDCLAQVLQAGYYCDQTALAKDIMQTNVLTLSPEMTIVELARQMLDNKPKAYPVVEDGKLLGLIDRKAVLKALDKQQQQCFSPS